MPTHEQRIQGLNPWLENVSREQRWCILINADPDAMGSASALKRILSIRTRSVDICRINKVTRPDNLAMIRYLRLEIKEWSAELYSQYTHFALVDSQPHHNLIFQQIHFSLVIDHHPLPRPDQKQNPAPTILDVRPEFGATSTILTGYLRGLHIRPSPKLATALLIGIRADTAAFERSGSEEDLIAYQWLSRRTDSQLVRRIVRSEYLRSWLPLFSRAFRNIQDCRGAGAHAWLGEVKHADLLVAIADFFTHVHGLKWIAVSGIVQRTVIVIFRSDGSRDIGRLSDACFYDIGSAGGHRTMGRAEFPLGAIPTDGSVTDFIQQRLQKRKLRPLTKLHTNSISPQPQNLTSTHAVTHSG